MRGFFITTSSSIDIPLCESIGGTHWLWHLLNGLTLYLSNYGLYLRRRSNWIQEENFFAPPVFIFYAGVLPHMHKESAWISLNPIPCKIAGLWMMVWWVACLNRVFATMLMAYFLKVYFLLKIMAALPPCAHQYDFQSELNSLSFWQKVIASVTK